MKSKKSKKRKGLVKFHLISLCVLNDINIKQFLYVLDICKKLIFFNLPHLKLNIYLSVVFLKIILIKFESVEKKR